MKLLIFSLLGVIPLTLNAYTSQSYAPKYYAAAEKSQGVVGDEQIKKKIYDELTNTWVKKKYENVKVEVENGEVTLTGIVESQGDLSAVEDRIKKIPGIKIVRNHLRVMSSNGKEEGYQGKVSDDQIRKKIQEQLTNTWVTKSYKNVKFDVDNGYVTLTGIVDSQGDLEEIEERMAEIPGIKVVRNQLRVMAKNSNEKNQGVQVSDEEILQKIHDKLTNTWVSKSYKDIQVDVQDGVVILQGIVDSTGDLEEVEDRLSYIPGIRVIRNRLQVQE